MLWGKLNYSKKTISILNHEGEEIVHNILPIGKGGMDSQLLKFFNQIQLLFSLPILIKKC